MALDLGSTSLGWAILRLNADNQPTAIIKAGVRIFSDGRSPKDGSSLAVTRRTARAMRRRRDRLLKRKARMRDKLIAHGFFPKDEAARKALEALNPYQLRAEGLQRALTPGEFARALFHINQRRGFKSNRKTDKGAKDAGAMKAAISSLRAQLAPYPVDGAGKRLDPHSPALLQWACRQSDDTRNSMPRTVGELLAQRLQQGLGARAKNNGQSGAKLAYDLYVDRQMVADEFDALWAVQAGFNPALFHEQARAELRDTLLHQRPLRPVKPGRCTLQPEEERAPLALPSTQRFRILQEVNHLRLLQRGMREEPLTLAQRDAIVNMLESSSKVTFKAMRKKLKLGDVVQFNLEDAKRSELKGNATTAALAKKELFGDVWHTWTLRQQDAIVRQLVTQQNTERLIKRLVKYCRVDEACAAAIANTGLPEGYGSLSRKALARIVPALRAEVITYDKAVQAAGFAHHSDLGFDFEHGDDEVEQLGERIIASTGEIKPVLAFKQLPYYGRALQRHVAFGSGNPKDPEEKRYGKIANPTVHIGLNQVRKVANALVRRYGRPTEIVVELARDLKQSREQKLETQKRQAENQKRNARIRAEIAPMLGISEERVKHADIQKWILWEELSFDAADRRCPYSGVQISAAMLLSEQVEIEHILPFSQTLDDSLNNKTVSMRQANRIKGNRTPWQAREDFEAQGWTYECMLQRAERMPKAKRYRFAPDGYERWLKEDQDFLARALNDTRYLSRIAKAYLQLLCPQGTWAIPGQMTALLRAKFGLNDVLGLHGEKNRDDHRHHAVDACVIGVTDQALLQRFAQASATARQQGLEKLVEDMPLPWESYRAHVERAVQNIWVSHKPDHGHEGEMFDATIYSASGQSRMAAKDRKVLPFHARPEHAHLNRYRDKNNAPKPYKGLLSNSNYCIEITRNEKRDWAGKVISTFDAYKIERELLRAYRNKHGKNASSLALLDLLSNHESFDGQPLVMRLCKGDCIAIGQGKEREVLQVLKINSSGSVTFIKPNETNISARYLAKLAAQKDQKAGKFFDEAALNDVFFQKAFSAGSLLEAKARRVTISPTGELRDPGFKG
nr:type II CRISPR RNA-guided endonuclease Cas9 [Allofranklinella schreckenbergeri]